MLPLNLTERPAEQVEDILNLIFEIKPNFKMDDLHQKVWDMAREHYSMPEFVNLYSVAVFEIAEELLINKFPELEDAGISYDANCQDVGFAINGYNIYSMADVEMVLAEIAEEQEDNE